MRAAVDGGFQVASEIELAFWLTKRPVIAVTGTNGKTTTTTMIGDILRAAGKAADVCGNIGRPMIEAPLEGTAPLVVEVSSFQLEYADTFRPRVAVLLNVAPDHIDWHGDFESYRVSKAKIFRRQTATDWAVAGADCADLIGAGPAGRIIVGGGAGGVFLSGGRITHDLRGEPAAVMAAADLGVPGEHNLNNAMAAAAAALALGVDEHTIARALRDFKGVEHRLEFVLEDGGVLFYNDSKATNPAAAATALKAFDRGIIWLAGGRNKGNSFEGLAEEAAGRVKLAVLFGESAPDLRRALTARDVPAADAGSLAEAVHTATTRARAGDVVLLAPACASFDMFRDYEDRGRAFKAAVLVEVGSFGKNKA